MPDSFLCGLTLGYGVTEEGGARLRAPERADYAARPHGGTRAETADRRPSAAMPSA